MLKYYNNTKTLELSCDFNDELKDIPTDTEIITFANNKYSKFNQQIKNNVLPVSLHTLSFGYAFNQEIKENVLPVSLHTLSFGYEFNQEIKENVLPKKLCFLTFGRKFNQEIKENVLPNSLHTINFGSCFNQEIKEYVLPNSLHTINFGWFFHQYINNVLPKSITKICLFSHCNLINNLPLYIEEVHIKFYYIDEKYDEIANLPITLKKILIDDEKYLKYITKIPFGCKVVIQSDTYVYK
jgi:hypothetical protein